MAAAAAAGRRQLRGRQLLWGGLVLRTKKFEQINQEGEGAEAEEEEGGEEEEEA